MGLVDIIKNPKNTIPEVTMALGNGSFALTGILLSESFGLDETESSIFIPLMKSTGALVGKIAGYGYCHKELFEEDLDSIKKDLKKISSIMIPYQIINNCVQTAALYGLQKGNVLDTDNPISTMAVIIGVDTVCSFGRYFFEHKNGILK